MNSLCLPPASYPAYFSTMKIEAIGPSDTPYGVIPQKKKKLFRTYKNAIIMCSGICGEYV
jgi:hypothetical protein